MFDRRVKFNIIRVSKHAQLLRCNKLAKILNAVDHRANNTRLTV